MDRILLFEHLEISFFFSFKVFPIFVASVYSFCNNLAFVASYRAVSHYRQQLKTHVFHFPYDDKSLSRKKKYFELSQS